MLTCYNGDKKEIADEAVNTIGNTLAEESWVIKSRIKLKVAEYEANQGRKVEYKELAEKVGVTQQQFSAWLNDRGWPRMDKVFRLAKLLECQVDDLYQYEEE